MFLCLLFAIAADQGRTASSAKEPFEIFLANGNTEWDPATGYNSENLITFFSLPDDGEYAFVIPGTWDASRLRVFLTGIESVKIGGRKYHNGDSISLPLNSFFLVKTPGNRPIKMTARKTDGLPVLFISTESKSCDNIHSDKTVREPGTLLMTDPDGGTVYEGELTAVRTRGNETFKFNKKSYQIKLAKSTALIGEGKAKTWILLADAMDRSHIRNTIALDLARYCGAFSFTPQEQSVDLYMNHDYKGTYLLVEKVETDPNRLRIRDLEEEIEDLNQGLEFEELIPEGDTECDYGSRKYYKLPAEPEDFTGGYLVQINKLTRYATEASGFLTNRGCLFTLQEPKYVGEAEMQYISSLFQQIEDALYSEDGVDPASGLHYTDLLDLKSLVNRYLVAEVLDDYDGQCTYFYKDSDSVDTKVYSGPVWDQDNILGVWITQCDPSVIHLTYENSRNYPWNWFTQASRHNGFRREVKETYFSTFRPAIRILLGQEKDPNGILRSVDEYAERVKVSAQMDFFRWENPLQPFYRYYNSATGDTFEKQIRFIKEYLALREYALDSFFLKQVP